MSKNSVDYFSDVGFQSSELQANHLNSPSNLNPYPDVKPFSSKKIPQKKQELEISKIQSQHPNQLPINLFHSAAQYRKILITNGKNVNKKCLVGGVIQSLQYINEPLYELLENKKVQNRLAYQRRKKSESIKEKSQTQCCCCCCQNYCEHCLHNSSKGKQCRIGKPMKEDILKTNQIIQNRKARNLLSPSPNKDSIKSQRPHSASQPNKKQVLHSNKQKNNHQLSSNKQPFDKSANASVQSFLKPKRYGIEMQALIVNTLCQFQEAKKRKHVEQLAKKKMTQQKKIVMKIMDEEIRNRNMLILQEQAAHRNKSQKKPAKYQLAKAYWHNIKNVLNDPQFKYPYQSSPPKTIKDDHAKSKQKKLKYTPQQIDMLRKVHEQQAMKKLQMQKKKQKSKRAKIAKSLQKLQKERINALKCRPFKPFKPTKQMIDNAFSNLNQN